MNVEPKRRSKRTPKTTQRMKDFQENNERIAERKAKRRIKAKQTSKDSRKQNVSSRRLSRSATITMNDITKGFNTLGLSSTSRATKKSNIKYKRS